MENCTRCKFSIIASKRSPTEILTPPKGKQDKAKELEVAALVKWGRRPSPYQLHHLRSPKAVHGVLDCSHRLLIDNAEAVPPPSVVLSGSVQTVLELLTKAWPNAF